MPPPNIQDVTDAKCPPDKPFKCLPYGTCHSFDFYCNKQHGDVVSCFPMEFKNNVTKILDWCRGEGRETFLNPGCQFACQYRFNSSELNDAPEIQVPESARENCSNVARDIISYFPSDKGSHNNESVLGASSQSFSSSELPVWFIALVAVFVTVLVISLIVNLYQWRRECRRRRSYNFLKTEGKCTNQGCSGSFRYHREAEEDDPLNRERQRNFDLVMTAHEQIEMHQTAETRQTPDSAVSFSEDLSETQEVSSMRVLQIRNSTSQEGEDHPEQIEQGGSSSLPMAIGPRPLNEVEIGRRVPNSSHTLDEEFVQVHDGSRSNISEPQGDLMTPRNSHHILD